jgi:hypothetical protein
MAYDPAKSIRPYKRVLTPRIQEKPVTEDIEACDTFGLLGAHRRLRW